MSYPVGPKAFNPVIGASMVGVAATTRAIFRVADASRPASRAEAPEQAPAAAPARGIKGLQERVKGAARVYLSRGNAAIKDDWSEF